jgi:hypothetical protein
MVRVEGIATDQPVLIFCISLVDSLSALYSFLTAALIIF